MAILDILEFPDPQLRTIARPVKEVDERIQQLISDMTEEEYDTCFHLREEVSAAD